MEERVSELRHVIVSTIKGPVVLECMIPTVISESDGVTLKRLYNVSMERANHRILDLLYFSTFPQKWRVFLDALQNAEYSCLLRLLQSTDRVALNTCCVLIDMFYEKLKYINLTELLTALRSKDIISEHDREEIVAKQTSQDYVAGAMLLLDRIQTHFGAQEWYSRFLQVLQDSNQGELVILIDPTFYDEPAQTIVDKEAMLNLFEAQQKPENETSESADVQNILFGRNQIKSRKRKITELAEKQTMKKKARRLQEKGNELNTSSNENSKLPSESGELLKVSKQAVSTAFTPNKSIGNFRLCRNVKETATSVAVNSESSTQSESSHTQTTVHAIANEKLLYEDKSSTSSYLAVSNNVPILSSDQETSEKEDNEREEESSHNKNTVKTLANKKHLFEDQSSTSSYLAVSNYVPVHFSDQDSGKNGDKQREEELNHSQNTVQALATEKRVFEDKSCSSSYLAVSNNVPILLSDQETSEKEDNEREEESSHNKNTIKTLANKKHLFEDKSSTSSYLAVSNNVPFPLSEQVTSEYGNKEREREFNAFYLNKCFEHDEYVDSSNYQNVYVEILRKNMSIDIGRAACSDIAMTRGDSQLIGLSTTMSGVCMFDSSGSLIDKFQCKKVYSRLARLSESEFVVVSPNDSAIHVIDVSKRTAEDINCQCTSIKLTVCASQGKVYVLCSGKHMHVYDSGKWTDVQLDGIDEKNPWMPSYSCININKNMLFIANMDVNDIYCFNAANGKLLYEENIYSNNVSIICALFCIDDHVFIIDKLNKCLQIYTAEDWLYRDSIEHEAFSVCKLVTVGASPDTLTVVCESIADEVLVNNEGIPVPFEDAYVLNSERSKKDSVMERISGANAVAISAFHGSSIGIVTKLGVAGALRDSYKYEKNGESVLEDNIDSGTKSRTTTKKNILSTMQFNSTAGVDQNREVDICSTAGTASLDKTSKFDIVYSIKIKFVE